MMKTIARFNNKASLFVFGGLLLLIASILPCSGAGVEVQSTWWDQSQYISALRQTLNGKLSTQVETGWLGKSYVAFGILITKLFNTDPQLSLVWLNRVSFVGTLLVFYYISFLLTHRFLSQTLKRSTNRSKSKVEIISSIISFAYTISILLSSNFYLFSDIPWTHFVATFLLLCCFLFLFLFWERENVQRNIISQFILASGFGLSFSLLVQLRFFEGLIFLISIIVWITSYLIFSEKQVAKSGCLKFLGLVGFSSPVMILAFYVCSVLSKSENLISSYLDMPDPFIKEYTKIYIYESLLKFVQIFIDTNFYTTNHNYSIAPIFLNAGGFVNTFSMPLFLQVPCLMFVLPFSYVFLLVYAIKFLKNRMHDQILKPEFLLPFLVGNGLILGYISNAAAGSPHLKYGFVRDFMAPTWCLALVCAPYIFYELIKTHRNQLKEIDSLMLRLFKLKLNFLHRFLKTNFLWIPILLITFIGIIYGQLLVFLVYILFKTSFFIQFPSLHISQVNFNPYCQSLECSFTMTMYDPSKKIIHVPKQHYIVNAICPTTKKQLAITLSSEKEKFTLLPCNESYTVNIYPTTMGFAGTPESPINWVFNPNT